MCWGGQAEDEGNVAGSDGGVDGEAVNGLRAKLDGRATGGGVIDRVGGAGGGCKGDWSELVDCARCVPAEEGVEGGAELAGIDRVQAAFVGQKRGKPVVEVRKQGVVGHVGYRRIVGAGKGGSGAQCDGRFGPRKKGEAVLADSVEQRGGDGLGGGRGIGCGRQAERAEAAADCGADGVGGEFEADIREAGDAVGEEGFDLGLVDGGGRQDPRACGGTGDSGAYPKASSSDSRKRKCSSYCSLVMG